MDVPVAALYRLLDTFLFLSPLAADYDAILNENVTILIRMDEYFFANDCC